MAQSVLPEIMQAIKGASSHRINRAQLRHGSVWQQENFDRAMRREESVQQKLDYILNNPVRARLVDDPLKYKWLWRETGEDAILDQFAEVEVSRRFTGVTLQP